MKKILRVKNPNDYARYVGAPVLHPLMSVIHYDELHPGFPHSLNSYDVYGLFIQRQFPDNLSYGTRRIQADDGSIIAVAPGQLGGLEDNGELISLSGWAVLWSPEIFSGTDLEPRMRIYQYFSYFATESLRMEPSEWRSITEVLVLLREELQQPDSPSQRRVLLAYLRVILEYCNRIYIRQHTPKESQNNDLLKRFQTLLEDYFRRGEQMRMGLPTVAYCARELAYSPRYFGDLIHQATSGTAIGYIHNFIVNQAKNLLLNGHNVNETAHLLGFNYPHHFTRLFKRISGLTPSEFAR